MYIVAIGWMFVVACMAAAEAATGAILGGIGTLLLYGVLPLGLVVWLVGTPQRRRNAQRPPRPSGASFGPVAPGEPDGVVDSARAATPDGTRAATVDGVAPHAQPDPPPR